MIDLAAAREATSEIPFDTVVSVLVAYLSVRKKAEYGEFLRELEAFRGSVERNGLGREVEQLRELLPQITGLVEENIAATRLAAQAIQLQGRVEALVKERNDAFMDRCEAILKGYLTSGTAGMQGLARMLRDDLNQARDT